jgi:ABC-type transporter Mla subunit MlaD
MRAALPVAAVLIVAALVALFVVTGSDDDSYRVRAIFDNAGFVIPGEDVKIAGVKVGQVDDVDVTSDFKAAVVLRIDDSGYQDFRTDASCIVRPQSLIGERFVECEPTQQHAVGSEPPGELSTIDSGPGEGEHLLPVENTQQSVDLDLINDIMRVPYRERLSIILNELGVGVAGRGQDLNEVIRRANPALKEVDVLLRLLAKQNAELESLAVDSDRIMQPLARQRAHVASSIVNLNTVAAATASRRADLEASIQRLPRFLRELRPTMTRLGALSDEMTPVLSDLGDVAPDINRFLLELGPFSQAGIPAVKSLGEAGKIGTPAVENSLPVIRDLRMFASAARPVGATLADVLASFKKTGGIERAMDYLFFQATAVNGFDSFGHYLRAGLIINQCTSYAVDPVAGCSANFRKAASASAAGAASMPRDPVLAWMSRVLQGLDPRKPLKGAHKRSGAKRRGDRPGTHVRNGGGKPGARSRPADTAAPGATATPAPSDSGTAPAAPQPAPAQTAQPTATPAPQQGDGSGSVPLLDYLFGGDG